MTAAPETAFYCVADERYFLGAVGLVNSLRLVGHDEPIFLLDCGLTASQRQLLGAETTLVDGPDDVPPWLLKTVAPLLHPAEVQVLIDADIVLTRALGSLAAQATAGKVVAFRDRQQRHFDAWGQMLGLGAVRDQAYVSSGLVLMGAREAGHVLPLMEAARDEVDFERTFWRRNERDYPFLYADQDVLNAILASRLDSDRLVALDNRLAPNPPYRGLRLLDAATLRCAYRDGSEPYAIHQYVRKPWLEPTYDGVYPRLLTRLLAGDDVAVRVAPEQVPLRLRRGREANRERARVNTRDFVRWHLGDRLPGPIATRVEARRRRREARHP